MKKRASKPFCKYGHDISICGRDKWGTCNYCIKDRINIRNEQIKSGKQIEHKKQFCINNHDTFICGRDKYGACKDCEKENREKNKDKISDWKKQYYIEHKEELSLKMKENYIKNRDKILAYQENYRNENPEILAERKKQYAKEHPEVQRKSTAKIRAKRKLSYVQFGQEDITEFYKNCPKNMTVDHYIPLTNDSVRGLHVIWNLQYLTISDNCSKQNKVDLTEISEWYGKLLETEGLK